MAVPFPRTLRALQPPVRALLVPVVLGLAVLAAWAVWAFTARVPIYKTTTKAQLIASPAPLRLQSPVSGLVAHFNATPGDLVAQGEVIAQVASVSMQSEMNVLRARSAGLGVQLRALEIEVSALEDLHRRDQAVATLKTNEAKHRLREEKVRARLDRKEQAAAEELAQTKVVSALEATRWAGRASARAKAADALAARVNGLRESETRVSEEFALHLARLGRDAAALRAKDTQLEAELEGLRVEIERRSIRAPRAGVVAAAAALDRGSVLAEGDWLVTLASSGGLTIRAEMDAANVSRVRPRQPALLRVDGYPWTQYGKVEAVVSRVASEATTPEEGFAVELSLPEQSWSVPLRHGMTGVVEIEVERLRPVDFLVRSFSRSGFTRP